jgi:nitrogen regulatory protein PII 2
MISVVVPDALVPGIVETIIQANQTGKPGDGKVFVIPISDAIRVRTEESGDTALDEA